MDIDFSPLSIAITDDDFSPLTASPLIVTAWHASQGFCENIPDELETLCREIEATGVSGACIKKSIWASTSTGPGNPAGP